MGKIIDQQGRLLGKINVIDFVVLLFFVFLAPVFYFGFKIYRETVPQPKIAERKLYFDTTIKCDLVNIEPVLVSAIQVGDEDHNDLGEVVGKIIKVGDSKPYTEKTTLDNENSLTMISAEASQVSVELKLKVYLNDGNAYYKNNRNLIKTRTYIEFVTSKYKKQCFISKESLMEPREEKKLLIQTEEKTEEKMEWITIKVKFDLLPEVARAIRKGDMERDMTSDRVLAKIISIESIKPASILTLHQKRFVKISHPDNKEVILHISALCTGKKRQFFYKSSPLLMGNSFNIMSDKYSLTGTILKLEEEAAKSAVLGLLRK